MENKKNSTDSSQNDQGFHGNQYVDSQGKPKSSTQNSGSKNKTGGKSTGGSNDGTSRRK